MARVGTQAGAREQAGEHFGGSTSSWRCLPLSMLVSFFLYKTGTKQAAAVATRPEMLTDQ